MAFDSVEALIGWLPGKLGVPVYAEVPKSRPDSFITIERTGGATEIGADRPALAVQTWGATNALAAELAYQVRDELVLRCAHEIAQICSCTVEGLYNYPDPDTSQSRYQLSVYLVCRL